MSEERQAEVQRLAFAAAQNVGQACNDLTGLRAALAEAQEREKRLRKELEEREGLLQNTGKEDAHGRA